MATAITITPCFICGKMKAIVKCEGCSKMYCMKHFEKHRQELSKQLEEVEVTRDLFRQSFTENIADSQQHSLIERIDKWENESINKIQQTADQARQVLLKYTSEFNAKMEDKLNNLTNQLRQSREGKDFFEPDLNQWIEELTQMKDELIKSSDVRIRYSSTPFITKINVKIPDGSHDIKSSKEIHMTIEEDIVCSICNEKFTSKNCMEEHMTICRNGTKQGPKWKKYIRQSIFGQSSKSIRIHTNLSTIDSRTHQKMQGSDQPCQPNNSDENVSIPCESGSQNTLSHLSKNPNQTRRNEIYNPIEKQLRCSTQGTSDIITSSSAQPCVFCSREMSLQQLTYHQVCCKMRPGFCN